VLPRLLGIAPVITPIAAWVSWPDDRSDRHAPPPAANASSSFSNIALMLLALFVFWGRGVEVLLGNDAG
jgi:hypothetical protein